MSLGAPVGGVIADLLGWRWSFGVQVPLMIASTLILSCRIELGPQIVRSEGVENTFQRIDVGGAVALVGGPLVLLTYA